MALRLPRIDMEYYFDKVNELKSAAQTHSEKKKKDHNIERSQEMAVLINQTGNNPVYQIRHVRAYNHNCPIRPA